MTHSLDIVGVGCAAADMLAIYEGAIEEDQKMQACSMTRQGGGLVATGLVAATRLGATTRYVGALGDDDSATFIIREFKNEGVDTSRIQTIPGMSAIRSMVLVNPTKGHRTIYYCLDDAPDTDPASIKEEDILAGKVIFVDGFQLAAAIRAAEIGRNAGRIVLMDAEMTEPDNDILAGHATHIVSSLHFAHNRIGDCDIEEAARRLHAKYAADDPAKVVGVTGGPRGSFFISPEGEFHQPSFKVDVLDTTGCGDVFHGAFAFGLSRDWPLKRVAEFASAVAALKARKLGGRAGIPNYEETEAFIKKSKTRS